MRRSAISIALIAVAALVAVLASPASASRTQESIFQDEGLLQFNGEQVQRDALDAMNDLGADTLHVLVGWRNAAPSPEARRKPSGFDGADPEAYPAEAFTALDSLVRAAKARNIGLIFTPTGSIPNWASRCSVALQRKVDTFNCDPDPVEFGKFVEALGKHFSGDLAVERWSFWNEANLKSWMRPQWKRVRGKTIPWSPHMYRTLSQAGIRALQTTGHRSDDIYVGEAAPIGLQSSRTEDAASVAPSIFYREMFCLDSRGRRFRGTEASIRGCNRFRRFAIDGITHHPYAKGGSKGPQATLRNPDEITVGYIGRLTRILTQAGRARSIPPRMPVYYTEYGVQTAPPDTFFGVSLAKQSEYINESDYMSWKNRNIRSVAQYLLVDDASTAGFNTGLVFNPNTRNGERKPAYDAYRSPIFVVKGSGDNVKVWGQARAAGPGQRVEIQNGDGRTFTTVQTVTTGSQGYLQVNVSGSASRWRLVYERDGQRYESRVAVPRPEPRERR